MASQLHKKTLEDYIISISTYIIYTFFAFVCVYPFYYILINSVSANDLSERGKVLIVPLKFHLSNYKQVMKINGLVTAFKISILRTVIGTILASFPAWNSRTVSSYSSWHWSKFWFTSNNT